MQSRNIEFFLSFHRRKKNNTKANCPSYKDDEKFPLKYPLHYMRSQNTLIILTTL